MESRKNKRPAGGGYVSVWGALARGTTGMITMIIRDVGYSSEAKMDHV